MSQFRVKLYVELVKRHAHDLYRFAYRMCGAQALAEDLVQEAFTEAWRSIDDLRDEHKARAWLFQILRHRYSHNLRYTQRRPSIAAERDVAAAEPDHASVLERQQLLQRALDGIDDRFKVPFLMVFLEGRTCEETATALQLPLGTVLSRIHRGRAALRKSLADLEDAGPRDAGGSVVPLHARMPKLRLEGIL